MDLQVEKQILVPQVHIRILRDQALRYGLSMDEIADALETSLNGRVVSQVLDGQRTFDVVLMFDERSRNDLRSLQNALIDTPTGAKIPLSLVAEVRKTSGPNMVAHENARRRIVIQANIADRDLNSAVLEIQDKVRAQVDLPTGYFITYGGQFESEQAASRLIGILSIFSIGMIF
ncbi:MAG: efflux RND transporter permease subunit, partial [Chloroflexi bacterium]|nr:efflux RND transporter permease subunit [Chloroflexota bacterium]